MEMSYADSQIEEIAHLMEGDGISPDEQDEKKLAQYSKIAGLKYSMDADTSLQLVYEALLYLKLKNSESADPLQEGDRFGIGFS